ncbi:MAG: efflux RND transporter periplasmic adaptor subunit [Dehalococcoidia bacterium]|nr:efflux RND transporter periplasmic adaptor subunit [Dehalococcoidia bacterium]
MKIRHIVVLIVVGVAAMWSGFTGYNRFFVQETKAAAIQGQVATVTRGSLQATAAASGNAVATHQQKLSFGTAGTLGELSVAVGDRVKAGQPMAKLDATTVATLQNNATQSEASLRVAQITLDQTQNPYTAVDLASAERAVSQAQASLQVAQRGLESALNPYSDLDLSQAEGAARNAAASLETVKSNLSLAENDPATNDNLRTLEDQASYYIRTYNSTSQRFQDGQVGQNKVDQDYGNMLLAQEKLAAARAKQAVTLATARNEVAKALDALAKAQDDLAKKKAGPDPNDVDGKRAQVINLQTALARAQEDLAKKQAGGDSKEILKQQNQVASAQAALDNAKQKLQGVIITAPFDGIVSIITPAVGDQVGANAAVISLLDPTAMRIDVSAAETDVSSIQVGQPVTVTFDALTNQAFSGKVISIAPSAKVQQGVVNYPVSISLDKVTGVKDLMTASATIVTQQRNNVILVSNRAIKTQGRNRTVQVLLPNGTTETRTIQIGMSGDTNTEATSGLQEGDKVVIPTTSTTSRGVPGAGGLGGAPGGGMFVMPGR